MHFRNKCTPYESRSLTGVVRETWLKGKRVYSASAGFDDQAGPVGQLLIEPRTV